MTTTTIESCSDYWQTGKSVTECNLHMLKSESCSDVTFCVGQDERIIRAHRFVLVSRSCVFDAMFCGPLAEKGQVTIPDIEHHIFKEFLRFVYTDNASVTPDNVIGLAYTSRKYAVDSLYDVCQTYLDTALSEINVCKILEQCGDYGEVDLEERALQILSEAGVGVLRTSGFLSLSEKNLKHFLRSDDLDMTEEEVYEGVMSWARERCKEEKKEPIPDNIRKTIGDLRYEIRYSTMPGKYLVRSVGPSGILSDKERLLIMDSIVDPEVDIFPFKRDSRHSQSNQVVSSGTPEVHKWQYGDLF